MNVVFCCTSINPLSEILISNARDWTEKGGTYYISLDRKAGLERHPDVTYIEPDRAPSSKYEGICPLNSYSRKNIAFIDAAKAGAAYIFETDDDNIVDDHSLILRNIADLEGTAPKCKRQSQINLFQEIYGTEDTIWARGFPLKWLEDVPTPDPRSETVSPGVVQFLVRGNPDVDAIFRLVKSNEIDLALRPGALPMTVIGDFHPFNSQATLWPKRHFALCYLPSTCSFRMTDIWRGYIAQRILYEIGEGVKFEEAAVTQIRNVHKIYKDFFDEHLGYVQSELVIDALRSLEFQTMHLPDMMMAAYTALADKGVFKERELELLAAFLGEF